MVVLTHALDDLIFTPKLRLAAEAEFAGRVGKDNYVQYEFEEYKGGYSLASTISCV